jgi:Serine dehydrogenase proteinase
VWTHDHRPAAAEHEQLGLPVTFGMPNEARTLMNLFPQPRAARSGEVTPAVHSSCGRALGA